MMVEGPRTWRWIHATALVCLATALTAGTTEDSHAWHAGVIIVIVGILLLRNSRKTESGAKQFLVRLEVRAAPFALLWRLSAR